MDMQNEAASALGGARPMPPNGQGAAPPPNTGAPQAGPGGSLAAFAQAFARCEQTKQCTPQDRQILEQGLPNLIQMAKMTQQLLQATAAQPQGGATQQAQP